MTALVLASALSSMLLFQVQAPVAPSAAADAPAAAALRSPTDGFGPDLKAWLDATKLQDQAAASKALTALQRLRADRNLVSVDDVASAISGRAEVRAKEGAKAESVEALNAAISFVPDSASERARKAAAEGRTGEALGAVGLAWDSPLEHGRVISFLLLGLLVVAGLFASGFSLAVLLRYAAVFSHDVAEGLPAPLKALALSMAVLFMALPLAGFMGWGYLPFWWLALFFIFESRVERVVSLSVLVALALSSLLLPMINQQRGVDAAGLARTHYLIANGGTSVEGEALVRDRLAKDPADAEWALLGANLLRRAGRHDEAVAILQPLASSEMRFAHNLAVQDVRREQANKGSVAGALPAFTEVGGTASLSPRDRATALYNQSLVQANTLDFNGSKETRAKGDALDAATLARYDRFFAFDRDGSMLQSPPDITPAPARILQSVIPAPEFSFEESATRLSVVAVALLLFIPGIVKFRGVQSFSKQCPKCGTTFCWLCQTRSTSQDVCSQCHYMFVVKRGIPPAARAAKNLEITNYVTRKNLLHRFASLVAPGSGHLSVGHVAFGLPVLLVWAISGGAVATLYFLAPHLVADGPLGSLLQVGFGLVAGLTYVAAQVVKPRPPVIAAAPRRVPKAEQEA